MALSTSARAVQRKTPCSGVAHLQAFSVDRLASIFSMGGTWPNSSTCSACSYLDTAFQLSSVRQC